ncbi:hypothetical protein AMS68_005868 [Peltaster fructicola]|uniref:HTH TFE/IIEalpha-type domain-containing protein n=1 Tax=Peltaster fructicola TaxID=286661 RepID=A0A6H0Y0A3_9PEZI|nr:hypothetical protein AMS68_005868 [Peltaster fructicola]
MAEVAIQLLRMVVRAFYHTEHILVIDALCYHSTLSDYELGIVVGMNVKPVRKIAGRLREDGLLSIQTRMERRTDGSGGFFGASHGQIGKERLTHRDWYYINFHKAIDAIKYRLWKLNKHVESIGAPTTEKKDLVCPQCHNQYTHLEVADSIDPATGQSFCHRCGHVLDDVEEDDKGTENEHMKRLNSQLEPFLSLMRQIDSTSVPENDFEAALAKHIPAKRDDEINPAPRTEVIDAPNRNIASTKGLEIKQEKVAVQLQDDETVKKETEAEEARRRREKEARQNALPEWISKSTVTGDITTVGAKEEKLRKEREQHTGALVPEDDNEDKKAVKAANEDVMNEYYAELERQRVKEAAEHEDDDDDEEDDDDFEDVDVTGVNTPAVNGAAAAAASTGFNTPTMESSNATDDEREAKRVRLNDTVKAVPEDKANHLMSGANSAAPAKREAVQSDEDGDDDDLEFENV